METNEIWKNVKGFEGIYEVSNLGNVKRHYSNKSKILKAGTNTHGYKHVTLSKKEIKTYIVVHKLVAIAFLNHIPNGQDNVINHIDHDKTNNNLSNLEIISQRENANKLHIKSTSDYIGVYYNKNIKKYHSRITINRKRVHLGYFENEKDASKAYEEKLNELWVTTPKY
jgi:hypothetical protein